MDGRLILPSTDKSGGWVIPPGEFCREPDFTNQAFKETLINPFLKQDVTSLPLAHQFIFSVLCDFYKTTIDNRVAKVKNPRRIDKSLKTWIAQEVSLVRAFWKILEILWARGFSELHPVQAFTRVLQENQLILVSIFYTPKQGNKASENLKRLQRENRQLQTLNNPFTDCYTATLINSAILLANQSDDFRKTEYKNFISARQGIASLFKQQQYTADPCTGKRLDQRGRRKKQ